ncbi:hypothetical protein C5S39_11910, partial [Candidatus Methanophagaceae archaeon]
PDAKYKYDAIYRLIEACGREHIGQASEPQNTWHDKHRINLAHPNDGQAMRNYFEFYEYDEVGNILKFDHKAHSGNWIRAYEYDEVSLIELEKNSNRLSCTVVHPNGNHPISEPYAYDPHGNMTSMPHLPEMVWDFKDQLHMVDKGGGCMAYYVYDAGGQRVRKVIEQNGMRQKERFYLGGFEVYRKYNGSESTITLERETLHVMDDQQRIALVETRRRGDEPGLPAQLIRYQLGNHLGSVSLEVDAAAQVISYEEYYPYGSTSYLAVRSQTEVPKRYRYTGMERDEESGLNYHTARYYAPWLGRWCSADPVGLADGTNLYRYSWNNPVRFIDPAGTWPPDTFWSTGERRLPFIPNPSLFEMMQAAGDDEQADEEVQDSIENRFNVYRPGELTRVREGARRQPYVPGPPHPNSGVTIGVGYDVAPLREPEVRQRMEAVDASPAVTRLMVGAAGLRGRDALDYLTRTGRPLLSSDALNQLFQRQINDYREIARSRSTGISAHHRADNPISEGQWQSLDPYVVELLTDLAWNTSVYAHGRQNAITDCIHGDPNDPVAMLGSLRDFVENLPGNIQRPEGRRQRLEWIDARVEDLEIESPLDELARGSNAQSTRTDSPQPTDQLDQTPDSTSREAIRRAAIRHVFSISEIRCSHAR